MTTIDLLLALLVGWCVTPLIPNWPGSGPQDGKGAWVERLTGVFGGAVGAVPVFVSTGEGLLATVVGAWIGATVAVELQRLGVHWSDRVEPLEAVPARWFAGVAAIASGFYMATYWLVLPSLPRVGIIEYIDSVSSSTLRYLYHAAGGVVPYALAFGFVGIWWVSRRGLGAAGHGGFVVLTSGITVIATNAAVWVDSAMILYAGMVAGLLMAAYGLLLGAEMPGLAVSGLLTGTLVLCLAGLLSGGTVPYFFMSISHLLIGVAIMWMGWEVLRRKADGLPGDLTTRGRTSGSKE